VETQPTSGTLPVRGENILSGGESFAIVVAILVVRNLIAFSGRIDCFCLILQPWLKPKAQRCAYWDVVRNPDPPQLQQ
jgi:hypothetical protein